MENEPRGRWIERLGRFALGDVEHRGPERAAPGPSSPAVPLFGGLIVAVMLYVLGAVALASGGGLAAITLGLVEIAVAGAVTVPPRLQGLPMIAFAFGLVTVVVGIAVLCF